MRYQEVGDYQGNTVTTFNFPELHKRNGVLIHELIEYLILDAYGIGSSVVDDFDTNKKTKLKYPIEWKRYNRAHRLALKVERAYIEALKHDWKTYDRSINEQRVPVRVSDEGS
jgi:hypothetical protein